MTITATVSSSNIASFKSGSLDARAVIACHCGGSDRKAGGEVVPAGEKPSGLPARVQETCAELQSQGRRHHDPELGLKIAESSRALRRMGGRRPATVPQWWLP